MPGGALEREEGALGVDRVEPVEVLFADVEQRLGDQLDAGVDDDDVQRAEPLQRRVEQAVDVGGASDVCLNREDGPARLFDGGDGLAGL